MDYLLDFRGPLYSDHGMGHGGPSTHGLTAAASKSRHFICSRERTDRVLLTRKIFKVVGPVPGC
jgi:hypothetical protein